MNDEELRAFLDSSKPGESQKAKRPAPSDAQPSDAPEAAQRSDGLRVPSFDELMGFTASDQHQPETSDRVSATPQVEAEAPQPRPALITDPVPNTPPADEDELVPLILPGFSPEPRRTEPLPPVFRSEPSSTTPPVAERSPYAPPASSPVMHEPAPTQPYSIAEPTPTEPMPAPIATSAKAAEPEPESKPELEPGSKPIAAPIAAAPPARSTAPKPAPVAAAQRPVPTEPESETDVFAAIGLGHETPESQPTPVSGGGGGDEYEPIAVTGGGGGGRKALPWIIVGGGLVIALVASVLVINGVRGNDDDVTPAPAPTTSEAPPPTTTEAPEPTETPEPEPEPSEAPVVDVGSTWTLPIDQWSINVQMSSKYGGSTPYELRDGNSRAMFTLPLAASLPDSCAHAREPWVWGLLKKDDGTLEAIRPEPRCTDADAAAVYDTLWGLLDASAKSATPM